MLSIENFHSIPSYILWVFLLNSMKGKKPNNPDHKVLQLNINTSTWFFILISPPSWVIKLILSYIFRNTSELIYHDHCFTHLKRTNSKPILVKILGIAPPRANHFIWNPISLKIKSLILIQIELNPLVIAYPWIKCY